VDIPLDLEESEVFLRKVLPFSLKGGAGLGLGLAATFLTQQMLYRLLEDPLDSMNEDLVLPFCYSK
jgi:hypothetical protein